jgi:hypothetical protein
LPVRAYDSPTCALGAGAGALSPATPTTPVSDGGSGSAGARGAAASPAAGRGRHGGNPRPPPHPIHLSPPYAPALWPLSSLSCRTARVAGGVDGGVVGGGGRGPVPLLRSAPPVQVTSWTGRR